MSEITLPAAEFQKLPLDFLIASPLIATVNAQRAAAETTKSFIVSFLDKDKTNEGWYSPQTVKFQLDAQIKDDKEKNSSAKVNLDVPLLSMVPVPHLRIDSLTTHFTYEVTQVVKDNSQTDASASGTANLGLKFLPFLNLSLNGSLSTQSSQESSTNRSGMLEEQYMQARRRCPKGSRGS